MSILLDDFIPFFAVRIMRILRIFKMVRHFVGLQSLVYTLHQAYKDLGLILIIISVTVLMFSSLVFAFEQDSKASQLLLWFHHICFIMASLVIVNSLALLSTQTFAVEIFTFD